VTHSSRVLRCIWLNFGLSLVPDWWSPGKDIGSQSSSGQRMVVGALNEQITGWTSVAN